MPDLTCPLWARVVTGVALLMAERVGMHGLYEVRSNNMNSRTDRPTGVRRLARQRVRARAVRRPILPYAAMAIALATVLVLSLALAARAAPPDVFPATIPLPVGYQPEGVATGRGLVLYAGSLVDGAIYRADLRTGAGGLLYAGEPGRVSVGLSYDPRTDQLYVAGGPTGEAYVHDGTTGEPIASYPLTAPGTFVNDVVVARAAAYFTDSFRPYFYRLPLAPDGSLPDPPAVQEVMLGGEWVQGTGFGANGVDATPDGAWLVIVNSTAGTVYRVDPETGDANEIALDGGDVLNGDGILLQGTTLYVVQNQLNQVAVIELAPDLSSGTIVRYITDPAFDVPTTLAGFGNALYAVNARFGEPNPDMLEYDVVRVLR
jgi:sugar lactone lactonase YvrE